jgi:hypothetical protein
MIYYVFKENKVYGATEFEELTNDIALINNLEEYEVGATEFEDYHPSNNKYVLADGEIVLNPNYEEEIAQKERERIAKLSCTKRDFALMLQELGVDYFTTLKPLIESNLQAQLEWELCERLYRFNPMLDLMASQLGVTSEQLDGLFKYANGEITLDEFKALGVKEEETETFDLEE